MKILFDTLVTMVTIVTVRYNYCQQIGKYKHEKEISHVVDGITVVTMGAAICFLFHIYS